MQYLVQWCFLFPINEHESQCTLFILRTGFCTVTSVRNPDEQKLWLWSCMRAKCRAIPQVKSEILCYHFGFQDLLLEAWNEYIVKRSYLSISMFLLWNKWINFSCICLSKVILVKFRWCLAFSASHCVSTKVVVWHKRVNSRSVTYHLMLL